MINVIDLQFQNHPQTIAAFLVQSNKGPVLIETGPHSTFPVLKKAIETLGYAVEDVRHVFLTHIHLDHGGTAWVFAEHGATIYLHPLGALHFQNPAKLLQSAQRIYGDEMKVLWGELMPIAAGQMRVVEHAEKVKIGDLVLKALHTPGHAIHHIAWQMEDVLFTGDVAGIRIGNGIVVPPCPPPDIHIGQWMQSIRMIWNRHFASLYLTHFGKVDNVKDHLVELQGRLQNWANWMKPFWEQQVNPGEITPLFQRYVAKQLEAGGIAGEDLEKYESANPARMSVAGLLRYWRKYAEGAL
jgi:glyoxylase-like metal-dependent hydrolase (beta-lactamase superfamily II)